ncbi:MAG: hypothetical protein RL189_2823 [Pseudomonadota bacterium]|jgi:pyrroloquinoline quinone (PQQ) biosynthesis protein C
MIQLPVLVDQVLSDANYAENPYFVNLSNGQFEKSDFVETQIQFYFAVVFFSRPMAALAAKIPTPEQRIEVIRNVWEEHGEGRLSHGHGSTFLEFLSRLANVTPEHVEKRGLWPEIRIFNTTLSGACVLDNYLIGVSALGIIERMFSDISAWIGQGVVKRGWLTDSRMIHYKLHSHLDVKHAQEFFDVLSEPYLKSGQNRYQIEQGLRLGATVFNGMYAGLWNNRKRRWELEEPMSSSSSRDF